MGQIQTLPDVVINQIAAGEVIERPASVVKELVENALDAQAHTVKVTVQNGGTALIQVDDDGLGMDAADATQCFTRHATSKIRLLEDLEQLTTMGFRGEALASIATVSRLRMVSRAQHAALGTRVVITGGTLTEVEPCGAPQGTSFQVHDLFYNTPARLKFLKHPATEASHIAQCFTGLALAAPAVHMTLHLNGRLHTQAPAVSHLGDRLEFLFGAGIQDQVLPVEHVAEDWHIRGYIAKPTFHRATRHQQFFFVNKRLVQNRTLTRALYEAFRTLLPRDRHPVAFLFLEMPASEVDVNVHPAKREVRFRQEAQLYDRLRRLFQQRLQESLTGSGVVSGASSATADPPAPDDACRAIPMLWRAPPAAAAPVEAEVLPPRVADTTQTLALYAGYPEAGRAILEGHPLGQSHDTYILLQYPDGLLLVDQHAAHERVLYEQLRDRLQSAPLDSQQLLFPTMLHLGATDPEWLETCLPRLGALGFTLEHFGGTAYRLSSVPALLSERDHAAALMDVLEVLRSPAAEEVLEEGLPRVFHRLLTVMACHGAIRAHQRLQEASIRALLQSLAGTSMPFTCPHGRPVLLHIGLIDIEKKFLRC